MRIGLMLPETPAGPDPVGEFTHVLRRTADDGFATAWMPHVLGFDALTALAIAGRDVEGIELATGVVPIYARQPHALAQQALTTQAAVDGRLTLGVGVSHKIIVESMFGLSFDKPVKLMDEYLSVLLPLLEERNVAFKGQMLRTRLGLSTPCPHPVPVLLAALAPRMLRLAGARTDGTVLWMTGPATVAGHVLPLITEAAAAAGRPSPRIVCGLPVCVTDDTDAARNLASEQFAIYGQLPSYQAMLAREGATRPGDVAIVGSPAEVQDRIAALADIGVTDFVAAEFGTGDEAERTRDVLRSLASVAVAR